MRSALALTGCTLPSAWIRATPSCSAATADRYRCSLSCSASERRLARLERRGPRESPPRGARRPAAWSARRGSRTAPGVRHTAASTPLIVSPSRSGTQMRGAHPEPAGGVGVYPGIGVAVVAEQKLAASGGSVRRGCCRGPCACPATWRPTVPVPAGTRLPPHPRAATATPPARVSACTRSPIRRMMPAISPLAVTTSCCAAITSARRSASSLRACSEASRLDRIRRSSRTRTHATTTAQATSRAITSHAMVTPADQRWCGAGCPRREWAW